MICPKCGHECAKGSTFCSKCGTRLVRKCKNCQRILKDDERYCPDCGTDNKEEKKRESKKEDVSAIGIIGFLLSLFAPAIAVVNLLTVRGFFSFWLNGIFRYIPFSYVIYGIIALYALFLVFSIIFRITKRSGWGITAIIIAAVLCLGLFGRSMSLFALVGSVMSYADRRVD